MDDQPFRPGDLVWFEPGIGFPLPGEILEVHEAAQITVIGTSIDGKQQTFTLAKDEGNLSSREKSEIDGVDDLTLLKTLNEACVLWNLRTRFTESKFYTFIGSILVSVNPYSLHSNLYGLEMAKKYAGASIGQLPPHIFAVGQAAYSAIVNQKQSQAVIVAGESGSGKTEANKLLVRYLTAIASTGVHHNRITEQILEAGSLLESFGNARTLKNDNSSRFGKYLEVYFKSGVIIGAKITHYLLEKSRIVTQFQDERNYHIFYELLSGLSESERVKFGLLQADKYFYLNQGNSDCAPNGSCKEWASLQGAMQVLGLTEDEKDGIIRILASILHLGNVYFHRKQLHRGVEGVELGSEGAECKWMAHLLEISSEDLIQSLKIRTTETRNDVLCTPLTIDQALDARDALAKTLYSGLFNWLVQRLNSIIHKGGTHDAQRMSILDIYGFESLQENSFEQLCINYANESLQLHFNKNVFKTEQAEYAKERLEWEYLEWEDNLPIIHLLAKKPVGIFHLLDDESNFPRASDASFLEKCHYNHALNEIYKRPRVGANEFGINHFGSGQVWYNVDGFLEKNRDAIRHEVLDILESSSMQILQDISKQLRAQRDGKFHPRSPNASTRFVTIKPRLSTASARFSDSLQHLLTSMSKCNPWFVRCIKPNHEKQAKKVDMQCVLDQMRFLRIVSTVEIRKQGYPVRLRFQHFVERYRHLLHNTPRGTPYRDLCKSILNSQTLDESQNYQIGATRIFLREVLHRRLENSRIDRLNRAATIIQKKVRKVLSKRRLQRQEDSAIILQKTFRGYRERKRYHELKKGVVTAQALYRGKKSRSEFEKIKNDNTLHDSHDEIVQQSRKVSAFESRKSINASSLDVPAELAFIFSKMDGMEQKHSDKHLVKVVGTVPGPPFSAELPTDLDQFAFSKFCSVYCDGLQLYFRREPISKPFLDRTATKDRDFHDSIMVFKLILRWMGDSSLDANKDKILADYIVHKGLSSKNLRDEILVQVANQLHGVDESQAGRLWLLMSHCLSSFAPGPVLSKYLMKFVKDNAPEAQNEIILKKLLRGNNQVARNYPPTYLEFRASKQSDIAIRMALPDGSLKTIAIDSWTTCEEAAALSLSMIPGLQASSGWTVVLDNHENENESTNDSVNGLDYVLDLIGEKEISPSFPSQNNNSRKIMPEIQQSAPKLFKSNGMHKDVEPLIKRPQTRPPAPPQQPKIVNDDGYLGDANADPTKVRRKASIDMLSRSSALNERYFEYEKGRSKSMDDLKNSNSENENLPEVEIITPLNEMGLSGSRLNDRYHSGEQNKPVKQLAPRMQKHVYAGKRLGSVNSYRTDRSELLVRSSAMSDTSETPSLASHVRRVRVPSQASDVDQFLDDLFSPVLDGNLDELSDARSLAASIRGNTFILGEDIDALQKPSILCKMIKGGGDSDNKMIVKNPPDESLEEYINDLFQPIFMNENVRILSDNQDLASTIKGGDEDFAEAGSYQQHVQRAFLESAMEQNIKIQQQLVAQNEALQTLLCQRSPDAKTNGQSATSPFESRRTQNGSKVFNYHGVDHIERKESVENSGAFSSPPIPPPMPPALEDTDPFQRPFMDPYGRAKTVRIGKWRWPPPDNVDGADDFIAFKLRQNQRKTTPQSQHQNGSQNQEHHQQDDWDKYQSIETVEKTREKNKSDSALNKITAVNKTQKRSFDLGAERPGPSSVGKLKLSTEMRQRLEKVTAGHSVRSTKSDSVSENQPLKLDESRKMMLEQQLRGNLSVRTQIQKMEASRIQKPFGPLPSIPPPPNSIPPAPPMQQNMENIPSFLVRMERDTFGVKNSYNDSQEKIEVEHLEMVYEVNRRSRSHSRERDNYDESLWDRSEVEGPPSNEEAYKSNIRDKSRKSEISQIERERESMLVYQPKFSEKAKRNSQSDQATFKNHMYSQKEREKKLSTLSQVAQENLDHGKEFTDEFSVNGIPKPVLAPALLKAPSACLTYGTKFPWKLRVKKEVFTPTETLESPIVINFIFAQIITDLLAASTQRISQVEKKHAFNFIKSNDIDLHSFHLAQIRNVTKRQLIEISRSWPLYFSRFFAVNGSPQYPDVSILAVNHSGGYLARKDSSGLVVVKQVPFDELLNITVLPRPAALQLNLKNGERCVLHVPKASVVHAFLQSFLNEHKMLKTIVNGNNGKNAVASPTQNVTEVYKISDSERVMSSLEKDAPISKNVKPATITSHQHQESQSSPTQTSVVKHSLLQFALQHFRYDVAEESSKNRPEKRTSHDRTNAANLVKWQGSLLEAPLLKLPLELNSLALECFECILRYCGDLPPDVNCSEVKCVYTVLMHCHKHLILRDEVFCQLMKQTTANRSSFPDSSQRAWRLLSILAAYFGCSESLKPYLIEHLTSATTDRKGTAAAVCLTNLRKTARCGGRKNVPSVEEVTAVSAGRSARRQIYRLPGGAERVVNTRCSTVVQDVISELCALLGVESEAEQQEFSLYCIVQGDAFTMPLCSDEYILDVTTELLKTNQPFYLIFCRSIWHFPLKKNPPPTPLYVEVLFNQVAPDYLEGLLLEIPNTGSPSLDYIRDIARIAAILHRAADLNHIPVMKEIKFLLPKPALGLRELKPAQWVNLVQTEFIKVLQSSPLQCKAEFLNVLSAWPLFGSSFFAVKRVYGDDISGVPEDDNGIIARELILALNRRGVLFLDSNTHETLHHWHFIEIISTRKVRSEEALYLDMKVGNLLQQNVIRVQTEQAHEISRIIRQYISMASTKDERTD